MNRRKFFAQLKKHGFSKSDLQMTRVGLTYDRPHNGGRIRVTVPKSHSETFTILGPVNYSGIFVNGDLKQCNWGSVVKPSEFGMENMLEVCIALISGDLAMVEA
jgi:hypothetical protein